MIINTILMPMAGKKNNFKEFIEQRLSLCKFDSWKQFSAKAGLAPNTISRIINKPQNISENPRDIFAKCLRFDNWKHLQQAFSDDDLEDGIDSERLTPAQVVEVLINCSFGESLPDSYKNEILKEMDSEMVCLLIRKLSEQLQTMLAMRSPTTPAPIPPTTVMKIAVQQHPPLGQLSDEQWDTLIKANNRRELAIKMSTIAADILSENKQAASKAKP